MPQHLIASGTEGLLSGSPARITLFVGTYGSGKSEISVNYALWLAREICREGQKVVLCDLDTINPYYRSADARAVLEAAGISLIAPVYANTNVDVPAVPAAAFSVFDDEHILAVLDIGGEDLGARVVGSMRDRLIDQDFAVNLVVNPYRPATATAEGIAWTADQLKAVMGLPLAGLVDNANLLDRDNVSLLLESQETLQIGSRLTGLPVVFAATMAADSEKDPSAQGQAQAATQDLAQAASQLNWPLLLLNRSIHYPTDPFAG